MSLNVREFLRRARAAAARALGVSAVALWLVFGASCNIVGPAAYIISGPPTVAPQHELADVPTVVFIDDRSNVVNPVSLRRVIADRVSQDLMVKEVLTTTISSQDAMTIAAQRERASSIMSIEEIGKLVGAKQVIYVEMVQFQDTPDGFTPRPMAACKVRVIDIEKQARVFPPSHSLETSRLVRVMTREVDASVYSTRSGRLQVFNVLAEAIGAEIGKVFYEHERKELGSSLTPK